MRRNNKKEETRERGGREKEREREQERERDRIKVFKNKQFKRFESRDDKEDKNNPIKERHGRIDN